MVSEAIELDTKRKSLRVGKSSASTTEILAIQNISLDWFKGLLLVFPEYLDPELLVEDIIHFDELPSTHGADSLTKDLAEHYPDASIKVSQMETS